MKHAALLALSVLIPIAAAPPALAQGTAEQREACEADAFKFCGNDIPDADRIEACLRAKLRQISPACRAQFRDAKR